MSMWRFLPKQRGFTLLELMVTVAVLAILLSIGVPSFRDTIENHRVRTVANDLLYHLQLARSEAVKRNRTITLCPSINGATCSGTDWSIGWLILDNITPIRITAQPNWVNAITPNPNTTASITFNTVGITTPSSFTVTVGSKYRYVCLRLSGAVEVLGSSCP